jgi:hypothetical protein
VPSFYWPVTVRQAPPVAPGSIGGQNTVTVTRRLPWQLSATITQENQAEAFRETIAATWTIALAILAGLIGVYIYRQNAAGTNSAV